MIHNTTKYYLFVMYAKDDIDSYTAKVGEGDFDVELLQRPVVVGVSLVELAVAV